MQEMEFFFLNFFFFERENSRRLSAIESKEPEEQIRSNNESYSNQSNKNLKFKTKIKSKMTSEEEN